MTTELNIQKDLLTMSCKNTKSIECPSCGAYLGEAVPGYLQSAHCFCGEFVLVPPPDRQDLDDIEEYQPMTIAS